MKGKKHCRKIGHFHSPCRRLGSCSFSFSFGGGGGAAAGEPLELEAGCWGAGLGRLPVHFEGRFRRLLGVRLPSRACGEELDGGSLPCSTTTGKLPLFPLGDPWLALLKLPSWELPFFFLPFPASNGRLEGGGREKKQKPKGTMKEINRFANIKKIK